MIGTSYVFVQFLAEENINIGFFFETTPFAAVIPAFLVILIFNIVRLIFTLTSFETPRISSLLFFSSHCSHLVDLCRQHFLFC